MMGPDGKWKDDSGARHSEGFTGQLSDEDYDEDDFDLDDIYDGWGFDPDPEDV